MVTNDQYPDATRDCLDDSQQLISRLVRAALVYLMGKYGPQANGLFLQWPQYLCVGFSDFDGVPGIAAASSRIQYLENKPIIVLL